MVFISDEWLLFFHDTIINAYKRTCLMFFKKKAQILFVLNLIFYHDNRNDHRFASIFAFYEASNSFLCVSLCFLEIDLI